MKIINYLYLKFFISFTVCLTLSFTLFYVFSILGNLDEKISFKSILYLSFLNSFQILTYVPSFILFISIIFLVTLLRTNNEFSIIKEYLSKDKIILFFIPIVISFTFIEFNRYILSEKIENNKEDFLNSNQFIDTKVIIAENNLKKTYVILKNVDIENNKIDEFHKYEISKDVISGGEYSNEVEFKDQILKTKNYTKVYDDIIINETDDKVIYSNLEMLLVNNLIIKDNKGEKIINFNTNDLIKIVFLIFFYICIFQILFNKKTAYRKNKLTLPLFYSLILITYFVIISSFKVNLYDIQLQVLSLILVLLFFYKNFKYE